METNIKRSETIVKKNRDDWVDEKGFLHTKITKEIITGPIDNVQAGQPANVVPLIPHIFNSIFRRQPVMVRQPVVQQQPVQVLQQTPTPQQMPLDINAFITMGKKLLEENGIDFKDLVDNTFKSVSENKSLEDKVEPLMNKDKSLIDKKGVKTCVPIQKNLKKKQMKTNQKMTPKMKITPKIQKKKI